MRRVARFQKVSWEQFLEGWKDAFPNTEEEKIRKIYDGIRLPRRATAGSAGNRVQRYPGAESDKGGKAGRGF